MLKKLIKLLKIEDVFDNVLNKLSHDHDDNSHKACGEEITTIKYKIIEENINCFTKWTRKYIYVIVGPIRIKKYAKLIIESGVQILLLNKLINVIVEQPSMSNSDTFDLPPLTITGSSLIFETGSSLEAGIIRVNACNEDYIKQSTNSNCGIFFCGSKSESQYSGIDISSKIIIKKSHFRIEKLIMNYTGSLFFLVQNDGVFSITKITPEDPTTIVSALPFNAVTVLGCDNNELMINDLFISNSGSNGLWSQYSSFNMNKLSIVGYQGNGLFTRGSQLEFLKRFEIVQNIIQIFPAYKGVLINIAEVINNKPNVIPFPPDEFDLPKNLRITFIKVDRCAKLYLIADRDKIRDDVDIVEKLPLINFNNSTNTGTYYKEILNEEIIFIRNNLSLNLLN